MDAWLGPDGKGMMDAFNPADHDLGVQTFGTLDEAEAEELVLTFTEITDSYLLAMPSVALNGVDYTVNVIDQPERFHILEGRTCMAEDEIVITEFIAANFGLGIGGPKPCIYSPHHRGEEYQQHRHGAASAASSFRSTARRFWRGWRWDFPDFPV